MVVNGTRKWIVYEGLQTIGMQNVHVRQHRNGTNVPVSEIYTTETPPTSTTVLGWMARSGRLQILVMHHLSILPQSTIGWVGPGILISM